MREYGSASAVYGAFSTTGSFSETTAEIGKLKKMSVVASASPPGGARVTAPLFEQRVRERLRSRGAVADAIRAFNWYDHPLGPIALWDTELVSSLNLILDAGFPMFLTWGAGDWLFYNDAYEAVLIEKPDSLGRSFAAVFSECWAEIGAPFEGARNGRQAYFENFHVSLVREARLADTWWSLSYSPVFIASGRVGGVLGVVYETTRPLLAEQAAVADAVTARDERLREFSSTDQTLMWLADVESQRIEALNPGILSTWGLGDGRGSVTWLDWMAAIHPDDRAQMTVQFDRMAAGELVQGRFRTVGPGGIVRWFYGTGFPVPCTSGAIRKVGGIIVDITRSVGRRVYLIDPVGKSRDQRSHDLIRREFKVRVFDSAAAFHRVADDLLPGCVVLTATGDFEASRHTAAQLRMTGIRLPWIVVGDFDRHPERVVNLMKLGATDILPADDDDAVAAAVCGALSVLQKVQETPRTSSVARQKLERLTPREKEVLQGIVAGGTNKTIAEALSLSPRTVETHRSHMMDRLGVGSMAELVTLALAALAEPRVWRTDGG